MTSRRSGLVASQPSASRVLFTDVSCRRRSCRRCLGRSYRHSVGVSSRSGTHGQGGVHLTFVSRQRSDWRSQIQAKTRMQTSSSEANRGALSLLVHIFRTEGVRNLYKGVGPPLLSLSIVNTVSFTSYSFFNKTIFFGQEGWDWRNAASGMCGSPLFGLITTPENLVKTQMQLDNVQAGRHRGRFANSFNCAQSLVKTHGVTILYTGHLINSIREACESPRLCVFQALLH